MSTHVLPILILLLQGVLWQVELLKQVWTEATQCDAEQEPVTASQLSSGLLTKLPGLVNQYSLQGGPRGKAGCVF